MNDIIKKWAEGWNKPNPKAKSNIERFNVEELHELFDIEGVKYTIETLRKKVSEERLNNKSLKMQIEKLQKEIDNPEKEILGYDVYMKIKKEHFDEWLLCRLTQNKETIAKYNTVLACREVWAVIKDSINNPNNAEYMRRWRENQKRKKIAELENDAVAIQILNIHGNSREEQYRNEYLFRTGMCGFRDMPGRKKVYTFTKAQWIPEHVVKIEVFVEQRRNRHDFIWRPEVRQLWLINEFKDGAKFADVEPHEWWHSDRLEIWEQETGMFARFQ